jgi:glycosyltransferase involved in cell wall biosynthesis
MKSKDPKKTILFYGQVGRKKDGNAIGGGEIGNAKTVNILSEVYNVKVIQRPYRLEVPFISAPIYILQLLAALLELMFVSMVNKKVKAIHISGFYFQQIYVELAITMIAKMFRKKCIYEMRAGGATGAYENGGMLYRNTFEKVIRNSDMILSQGKENFPLLRQIGAPNIVYYPNYVTEDIFLLNIDNENRENDPVLKLVYFGRINKAKNIETMLYILKELIEKNVDVKLILIGRIKIVSFRSYIYNLISELNLANFIVHKEPIYGIDLWKELTNGHFYLFPTENPREGHSNALTEAMALGMVPVCSNHGFNRTVVGNDSLVIDNLDAQEYAKTINNVWSSGAWKSTSIMCKNRVKSEYTEQIIKDRILREYRLIM